MLWERTSSSPPQRLLKNLARRFAHLRCPNLEASDQAPVNSLPYGLADKGMFYGTGLNKIKDRPKRAGELEGGTALHVVLGRVGIVENQYAGNLTVSPEVCWHRHVQLCRVDIRQIVQAERCLVAI